MSRRAGFTLLEVMVAIFVFAIIMGALLTMVSLQPLAEGQAPALVLAAGFGITTVVFGAILCALPAGRRTVSDVRSMLRMFRRDRRIL